MIRRSGKHLNRHKRASPSADTPGRDHIPLNMSAQATAGATPAPAQGGVALPPTTEQLQTSFDSGIWYALSLWPALHVAIQNSWGGPDSSDKKDWFAGAVSSLFTENAASGQGVDNEELEVFLLQIMQDEFECNVEDDSEVEIARTILALRKSLMERDLSAFRALEARWRNRGQMKANIQVIDNGELEEDEEEFEGFSDDDGDVDMDVDGDGAAPKLVPATVVKEKLEPVVDDDGFTKVVGKGKKR